VKVGLKQVKIRWAVEGGGGEGGGCLVMSAADYKMNGPPVMGDSFEYSDPFIAVNPFL